MTIVNKNVQVEEYNHDVPAFGEIAGSATAAVMPYDVPCTLVNFKAQYDNVGRVYLGVAGVTKADGTSDQTTGWQLSPGEETGWIPANNINLFYRICDNAGDDLVYMAITRV